jgi:hypothetical protein
LLGLKDVVALPFEPVRAVAGETVAVNPACGAVVTLKVYGTPGWVVPSFAVTVIGEPPAVNEVAPAGTVTVVTVPTATSYEAHVGPGYEAGEEPPSMRSVVNVPSGGTAVTGDAVLTEMPPKLTVSLNPGASDPVQVTAAAVCTVTVVR